MNILERLLETATCAPSAHNRQPWRFVILDSATIRQQLTEAMSADFRQNLLNDGLPLEDIEARLARSRQHILGAPCAILLCLDTKLADEYPDEQRQQAEFLMGVQGVAMAGVTLLFAAHTLGLGGVWLCAPLFAPETVRHCLNLSETWLPQGLILLGYPAENPEPCPRQPVREVSLYL